MKYLSRLSKEELTEFFASIGIEPFIYEKDGEKLPPFVDGETGILFKCKITPTKDMLKEQQIKNAIYKEFVKRSPMFAMLLTDMDYMLDGNILLIDIKDYETTIFDHRDLSELDKEINEKYVKFMYKTFGEEYRKDYNNYVDKINSEIEEDQKNDINNKDEKSY